LKTIQTIVGQHISINSKVVSSVIGQDVDTRQATAYSEELRDITLCGISLRMRIHQTPCGLRPIGMCGTLEIKVYGSLCRV